MGEALNLWVCVCEYTALPVAEEEEEEKDNTPSSDDDGTSLCNNSMPSPLN